MINDKIYDVKDLFLPFSKEEMVRDYSIFGFFNTEGEKYVVRETENGYKYYNSKDEEVSLNLYINKDTREIVDISLINSYKLDFEKYYNHEKNNYEANYDLLTDKSMDYYQELDENSAYFDEYSNNKDNYYDNLFDDIE